MDLITIYQDNDIKIEVAKLFHDYLEDQQIKWISLNYAAKDFLYGQILKILDIKSKKWIVQEKLTASQASIIEAGRPIFFQPPFDVFNEAIGIISNDMLNYNFDYNDIEQKILSLSEGQDFEMEIHFFPTSIFKINGFLTYFKNGSLLIILFNLKEE